MMVSTIQPGTTMAQEDSDLTRDPDGDAVITITAGGTCKIVNNGVQEKDTLQCRETPNGPYDKACPAKAVVDWKVTSQHESNAVVILLNFKHQGTGFYLDPLRQIGRGVNRAEHFVNVKAGGTKTLRALVREFEYFKGPYEYRIAISFTDGTSFALCPDPMIDIIDR